MFGALGGVLQQVASGMTTGTVPLAIATIAIAGGAATIAPMLIAG